MHHIIKRLRKISKKECLIYWGAFWGVLTLGTINGVLIGIILSFAEMIIRTAKPARCFLGVQPGHRHFEDLTESLHNCEIEGVVIYRFSSSLFFANIDILQQDIENAIGSDTKAVILDASGIGSIDVTAADRLAILYRSLKSRGIRFYITEHIAELNEQMRALGLGFMIEEGRVRRTIHVALKDMGIHYPYPLKGNVDNTERSPFRKRVDNSVQEFVWAFGSDSEAEIEKQIRLQIEQLKENGDMQELLHGQWNHMDELDADAWIEHLEEHMKEIVKISGQDEQELTVRFEKHRKKLREQMMKEHPELVVMFEERRQLLDEQLERKWPDVYALVLKQREKDSRLK